jgi:hypothetical protein
MTTVSDDFPDGMNGMLMYNQFEADAIGYNDRGPATYAAVYEFSRPAAAPAPAPPALALAPPAWRRLPSGGGTEPRAAQEAVVEGPVGRLLNDLDRAVGDRDHGHDGGHGRRFESDERQAGREVFEACPGTGSCRLAGPSSK